MSGNSSWMYLGEAGGNKDVITLLNNAGIGKDATVTINTKKNFVVWGDHHIAKNVLGYVWESLGETGVNQAAQKLLQDSGAIGGMVALNSQNKFVIWGYVNTYRDRS